MHQPTWFALVWDCWILLSYAGIKSVVKDRYKKRVLAACCFFSWTVNTKKDTLWIQRWRMEDALCVDGGNGFLSIVKPGRRSWLSSIGLCSLGVHTEGTEEVNPSSRASLPTTPNHFHILYISLLLFLLRSIIFIFHSPLSFNKWDSRDFSQQVPQSMAYQKAIREHTSTTLER